jgi:hypothetical protein
MIPSFLLYKVYAAGSLRNAEDGVRFEIVNRLMNIEQVALRRLSIDGAQAPMDQVRLGLADAEREVWIDSEQMFPLPLGARAIVRLPGRELAPGAHEIEICIEAPPFGEMQFAVKDSIREAVQDGGGIDIGAPACATPVGNGAEPSSSGETGGAGPAGSQDSFNAFYDAGLGLLSSAMGTYLGAQKALLNMAIQQAEKEQIVGNRASEFAQSVVTELTTSFDQLAREGVKNFATAGRLLIAAAVRPSPGRPTQPEGARASDTAAKSATDRDNKD